MKNTKIYNVLLHFNKYEQNKLRKFMLSPYFNSDKKVVELYDLVMKYQNGSRKKELSKEALWKKLSGNKSYDDVRFRKYCSSLLKVVESFIAHDYVEKEGVTKFYLILEAIKKRKIENLYSPSINTSKKLIESIEDKSAQGHLNKYLVEKSLYDLSDSELNRMDRSNIESISDNLDNLYFSEKLRYYTSALYQQRVTAKNYEIDHIETLIGILEKSDLLQTPSISVYYYMYLSIKFPENEEYYLRLKELLTEHSQGFPNKEALSLYYSQVNYCIKKVNSGKFDFYDNLNQVYDEMLDRRILFDEFDEMSPWDFKNIVGALMFRNKFEKAEAFIKENEDHLSEKYRETQVRFALGRVYFGQKKYNQVVDQLIGLETKDLLVNLHAKTYTVYTYYELKEFDYLYSFIESFRVFLGRKVKSKELASERQQRYVRFLNLVKKMTRVIERDKKSILKFEADFEKDRQEGLVGAKWLSEKIDGLKNPFANR